LLSCRAQRESETPSLGDALSQGHCSARLKLLLQGVSFQEALNGVVVRFTSLVIDVVRSAFALDVLGALDKRMQIARQGHSQSRPPATISIAYATVGQANKAADRKRDGRFTKA